jgi:hypothetical protein
MVPCGPRNLGPKLSDSRVNTALGVNNPVPFGPWFRGCPVEPGVQNCRYCGPRRSETTAFLTDLFDVTIRADPFPLLRTDFDLWVGIEPWAIDETTSAGRWVLDKLRGTFGDCDPWLKGQPILNAGILGGFRAPLLGLLYDLWSTLAPRGPDERRANCMAALNTLVYRRPDLPRVWRRGAPLHSVFKGYQQGADVCFVHK